MADEEERPRRPRRDDEDADERPRRRRRDEDDDYDDDDERPRRPRRDPGMEAASLIIPVNVSIHAMLAGYLGLFSCFIPVVGILMALLALLFGVLALRKRKQDVSYGQVTGQIRVVIGMICAVLTLIAHVVFIAIAVLDKTR